MTLDNRPVTLEFDLPAQPQSLVTLAALLREDGGLTPAAVASVRHHVSIHTTGRLPRVSHRYICVLSALAHTIVNEPERLDEVAMKLAPQAMLDQTSLLRGLHRVKDKID